MDVSVNMTDFDDFEYFGILHVLVVAEEEERAITTTGSTHRLIEEHTFKMLVPGG